MNFVWTTHIQSDFNAGNIQDLFQLVFLQSFPVNKSCTVLALCQLSLQNVSPKVQLSDFYYPDFPFFSSV